MNTMAKDKTVGAVAEEAVVAPVEVSPEVAPSDDRQARWEAFLVKAEAQAVKWGTIDIFNAQKNNGEFSTIAPSFE